ncbi:MAG TPA: NUDIX hydrolase [Xanthobacteraceae bacterium]|nr:NUDIX hydrolase [Xanthobacteraceae bacterium]
MAANAIEIVEIERAEIVLEPWQWPFAVERHAAIARHFVALQQKHSGVWNGRVLLMHRFAIGEGRLHGACFETDYASFCAWRDWDFPDPAVANVFAAAALRSADGAWLLGEMGSSTANGGRIYFPCGTPEPADIAADGTLDLAGSVRREFAEETGIDISELKAVSGWSVVIDRCYVALIKRLTSPLNADELFARVKRFLEGERQPELSAIRMARNHADLDARMPNFIVAFLEREWRQ